MDQIMAGAATPAQIAAFGVSMKMKRPSAAEVRELADTMLAYALRVPTDVIGTDTVDVVGTGGDRVQHGESLDHGRNRRRGSRGAGGQTRQPGRLLEERRGGHARGARGPHRSGPDEVARCVAEVGIGFCFAPVFHPPTSTPVRHAARSVCQRSSISWAADESGGPRSGLIGCAFGDLAEVMAGVSRPDGPGCWWCTATTVSTNSPRRPPAPSGGCRPAPSTSSRSTRWASDFPRAEVANWWAATPSQRRRSAPVLRRRRRRGARCGGAQRRRGDGRPRWAIQPCRMASVLGGGAEPGRRRDRLGAAQKLLERWVSFTQQL